MRSNLSILAVYKICMSTLAATGTSCPFSTRSSSVKLCSSRLGALTGQRVSRFTSAISQYLSMHWSREPLIRYLVPLAALLPYGLGIGVVPRNGSTAGGHPLPPLPQTRIRPKDGATYTVENAPNVLFAV